MRKEKTVTIEDRGNRLTFKIREMPALKLESWIIRAALVLAGSGLLDADAARKAKKAAQGMETGEAMRAAGELVMNNGLAALASVDYEKVAPLLDELLACCSRIDAGIEQKLTPDIVDAIVSDVRTLFTLRKEAFAVNFGFFALAGESGSENGETPPQGSYERKISVRQRP